MTRKNSLYFGIFALGMLWLGAGTVCADELFSFGPDSTYVASDAVFSDAPGTANVGGVKYIERQNYNPADPLTPSSGYTGPEFYGAHEITSWGLFQGFTKRQVRNKTPEDYLFLQAYQAGGYTGNVSVAGFFLFKQEDFNSGYETGSLSVTGLSVTVNCYNSGEHNQSGRWVVEKDGTFYVSQTALTIYGTSKVSTLDPNELWTVYDPADPTRRINFNQAGATYSALDLTGVTAAGIYFEHDLWDAGTGNEAFSFAVKAFEVSGALGEDPEPDTASAAILDITPFSDTVMKLTVSSDNPGICYPKTASALTTNTVWSSVGHSTNGLAPFAVTNLGHSAASGTNFIIYVEADADQKFFDIGAE